MSKAKQRGAHRQRRERRPWAGMRLHQDGSTHEGVPGPPWDLIVTRDDAPNEPYSLLFVDAAGPASRLRGGRAGIAARGWFCARYTDRGRHYWHTPAAGGQVDKGNLTPFGEALKRLGIALIPAYSPEARGRSERAFATPQARLPKERVLAGITDMAAANRYREDGYRPACNREFSHAAREEGSAFVPFLGGRLDEVLGAPYERPVGKDHGVRFEGLVLPIPADRHRCHSVKAKVRVYRYADGSLAVFHGPRPLAS